MIQVIYLIMSLQDLCKRLADQDMLKPNHLRVYFWTTGLKPHYTVTYGSEEKNYIIDLAEMAWPERKKTANAIARVCVHHLFNCFKHYTPVST